MARTGVVGPPLLDGQSVQQLAQLPPANEPRRALAFRRPLETASFQAWNAAARRIPSNQITPIVRATSHGSTGVTPVNLHFPIPRATSNVEHGSGIMRLHKPDSTFEPHPPPAPAPPPSTATQTANRDRPETALPHRRGHPTPIILATPGTRHSTTFRP